MKPLIISEQSDSFYLVLQSRCFVCFFFNFFKKLRRRTEPHTSIISHIANGHGSKSKTLSRINVKSSVTAMNRRLAVLQYNVYKSKNQVMVLCLRNPKCLNYDVLVIQKSWINSYSFITHHFIKRNFHLIYFDFHKINDVTIKMCFFVNNRIFFINIKTHYVFDDLIILQICINNDVNNSHANNHYFQIHNIYNESVIDSCTMLSELQTVLKKKRILTSIIHFHHFNTW